MKQSVIIVLIMFYGLSLNAQQIADYKSVPIGTLPIGSGEGQVGYNKSFGEGGGFSGPTNYAFSPEGDLYISDYINSRIDVFNRDFHFVKNVIVDEFGKYPIINRLEVNRFGEIIAIIDLGGIFVLDIDGNILFRKRQNELPRTVTKAYNIFFYADGILYFDDLSKYHILDKTGGELSNTNKTRQWAAMVSQIETQFKFDKDATVSIISALRAADVVWDNGRLLTTDFTKQMKLWDQFRNLPISKISGKNTAILDKVSEVIFLGFDAGANSYWVCFEKGRFNSRFVLIMSPLGKVVEYFTSDMLKYGMPVVAPNGDIYFMFAEKEGVSINRIKRVW